MGTHPIFESDFDCLTDSAKCIFYWYGGSLRRSLGRDRFSRLENSFPSQVEPVAPITPKKKRTKPMESRNRSPSTKSRALCLITRPITGRLGPSPSMCLKSGVKTRKTRLSCPLTAISALCSLLRSLLYELE